MSVGSMRSPTSSATCFLKKNDSPKSPRRHVADPHEELRDERLVEAEPARGSPSTSCVVADEPAMIAAGSPGVRRSSANTKIATIAITGIVASRRLAM